MTTATPTNQPTREHSTPLYAVAKGGPNDYAVLDLQRRRVVSKHATEAEAMEALERLTFGEVPA